jgi:hypothetical protein
MVHDHAEVKNLLMTGDIEAVSRSVNAYDFSAASDPPHPFATPMA